MTGIVIYGIGSPIVADIEESLARAGIPVLAAVRNYEGTYFFSNPALVVNDIEAKIKDVPYMVPLFTPGNRQRAAVEAKSRGLLRAFSLIDPSVCAPRTLNHAPGLYINAGCTLGAASEFGPFAFINRGASIGHHFRCGPFVSIGPGAVVCGQVTMEKGAFVGGGAVVLPKIKIGVNAVVGAGAVVTRDVPDHCLMVGNPARIAREVSGYSNLTVK